MCLSCICLHNLQATAEPKRPRLGARLRQTREAMKKLQKNLEVVEAQVQRLTNVLLDRIGKHVLNLANVPTLKHYTILQYTVLIKTMHRIATSVICSTSTFKLL